MQCTYTCVHTMHIIQGLWLSLSTIHRKYLHIGLYSNSCQVNIFLWSILFTFLLLHISGISLKKVDTKSQIIFFSVYLYQIDKKTIIGSIQTFSQAETKLTFGIQSSQYAKTILILLL